MVEGTPSGNQVAGQGHDLDLIRGLQERAARAQPAEHVERIGDWWLRDTGGPSWWTGTVLAHGAVEPAELAERIEAAERFYDRFQAGTAFQLTPGVADPRLDDVLAERGYLASGPLSLMTACAAAVAQSGAGGEVRIDAAPSRSWLEARNAIDRHDGVAAEERMLSRVAGRSVYASAVDRGEVVGVGRAVLDDGWAGVFGMATLPRARGRGVGRRVLAALAGLAADSAAAGLYLQVERDNGAALGLYDGAGFAELARYHYRARPPS
ncbi:GNAT family N-acetyltransferase [Naasia sp. SYSU D00948]|uniref:GNAT family N-acetyltransferase n=1 Tax=Naasia sp. SYSU D00948 TaxID=2817379 RepID=UPI001B30FF25|nr:GNAT family N-acetyltransferase [Naasia sp. SYSU D00948]